QPARVPAAGATVRLLGGAGSCGLARGAAETLQALRQAFPDADVRVGACPGLCYAAPVVDLQRPDAPRLTAPRGTPDPRRVPPPVPPTLARAGSALAPTGRRAPAGGMVRGPGLRRTPPLPRAAARSGCSPRAGTRSTRPTSTTPARPAATRRWRPSSSAAPR